MEFEFSSVGLFIVIVAIVTLSLSVIVRNLKIFVTQAILIVLILFIPTILEKVFSSYLLLGLELTLIIFAIYKYKRAIDINYQLVLEKTNKAPRVLTVGGAFGDEKRY